MDGEVPKPLAMVGAVEEIMRWPPLSANAVELVVPVTATPAEVNEATVDGAVFTAPIWMFTALLVPDPADMDILAVPSAASSIMLPEE